MLQKLVKMIKKFIFLIAHFAICITIFGQTSYDDWVSRSFDYIEHDSIPQAIAALKEAMRLEPANPQNALLLSNMGTL